jgi:hypothetical protein
MSSSTKETWYSDSIYPTRIHPDSKLRWKETKRASY